MPQFSGSWKPIGTARTQLFLAALVWSLVGTMLLVRGVLGLSAAQGLGWAFAAVAAGTVKSLLVLDRSALKNSSRITCSREGRCLGGLYSWKMWGFIGLMILLGWVLRHSELPRPLVWGIYVAVGWGLFFSSRKIWVQWHRAGS